MSRNTADRKAPLVELPIATSDGIFLAHYSERGLAELDFPNTDGLIAPAGHGNAEPRKPAHPEHATDPQRIPTQFLRWHRTTTEALKRVLAGRAVKALPPLDWTGKTEFQQSVWREMLKLGPGQTKSYGEVAKAIGKPKAVRAVGGACGANPIPVVVPCHRILAAHQKIGGFSSGLDRKRDLLARERINL
jgi:O-6-methylguanine DNA methyltransferase